MIEKQWVENIFVLFGVFVDMHIVFLWVTIYVSLWALVRSLPFYQTCHFILSAAQVHNSSQIIIEL